MDGLASDEQMNNDTNGLNFPEYKLVAQLRMGIFIGQ